ncbi:hypothetical protein FHX75_111716 [Micromonospora palomenae]|uniref:Uncharacterized protein n=1 Tax=Micromonospora palomenae TaxID=1461247 RepID=A0A561WXH9_9ACTN|nr:hypothetical protein [Micromonospora palomenae]TWG28564.1 hypothetical protein FHX75_111716 [Micromonospora palomenae]
MAGPSAKYVERAGQLTRAIDIGARVLADRPQDRNIVDFGEELKELMKRPPQTVAGLRYLESAFLTYWNEATGRHVDQFWELVAAESLPFTRRNVLADVLARGRINNAAEHEAVVDSLVGAEQEGTIAAEQAVRLSDMVGRYERRGSRG